MAENMYRSDKTTNVTSKKTKEIFKLFYLHPLIHCCDLWFEVSPQNIKSTHMTGVWKKE